MAPSIRTVVVCMALTLATSASAQEAGRIRVVQGTVAIERGAETTAATTGARLLASDTIRTGADGAAGILLRDDSLLSIGPNSVLSLARYAYDPVTQEGRFDAVLNKGTLAVVSGRIAKRSPEAVTVRTPAAILGVRGTEFIVSVDE